MTPNKPKTPLRAVRVPDQLWDAARAIATERGETVSDVVRAALELYVQSNESQGDEK